MTEWTIKVTGVNESLTKLSFDYDILKDSIKIDSANINLEGDVIDIQYIKSSILKRLKRMIGIDEKASTIKAWMGKEFEPNEALDDIVLKK